MNDPTTTVGEIIDRSVPNDGAAQFQGWASFRQAPPAAWPLPAGSTQNPRASGKSSDSIVEFVVTAQVDRHGEWPTDFTDLHRFRKGVPWNWAAQLQGTP